MKLNPAIVLNGEFVSEHKASVSPVNRGMMYGDGCFETLRLYEGKFLGWANHFDRLSRGLDYLGLDNELSSEKLKELILKLTNENGLLKKQAMIRIQFWRDGGRGYATNSSSTNWMAQVSEVARWVKPFRLTVATTRCIPSQSLDRRFKLSNGLNYIMAAKEADVKQADDALMLTINDKISETTSSNIFWIEEGKVFTPSKDCDLLPGVTRSIVKELCQTNNIPLETGTFQLQRLKNAEAVFCTNSLIELHEVANIDDAEFNASHSLISVIKSHFEDYKEEHLTR